MTATTTNAHPAHPVFGRIRSAAAAVFSALAEYNHAAHCAREAERLFRMSEQELAKRGLTRDRMVHHAFGPYLYI
jgi:hypothetical protein